MKILDGSLPRLRMLLLNRLPVLDQVIINVFRVCCSVLGCSPSGWLEHVGLHMAGDGLLVLQHVLLVFFLGVEDVVESSSPLSLFTDESWLEGASHTSLLLRASHEVVSLFLPVEGVEIENVVDVGEPISSVCLQTLFSQLPTVRINFRDEVKLSHFMLVFLDLLSVESLICEIFSIDQ